MAQTDRRIAKLHISVSRPANDEERLVEQPLGAI
jgi:hypothetical protein